MKSSTTTTALATLALAGSAAAFWRMPCRSHTGVARIDPLVAPGAIADHSHIVFGGGNFGKVTDYESLAQCQEEAYNCTSCGVTQDMSAYWTPPLYFQHTNGTVEMVPNVGGMLAYYLFYLDNLKPFPEGFQMIAGDPTIRNFTGPFPDAELSTWPTAPTDQFFLEQRAIGYNCLNYAETPEPSLYRHQFPEKSYMDSNCLDGLRLEMAFPSCGTGAKDSDNHRSHVAYPSLVKEGNCPEGYDVHYPFLFYETIFATQNFAGVPGQFIISTGDPIGASYHADFIMGWQSADFLGQAIETCTSSSGEVGDCPLFNLQSDEDAAKCKFSVPTDLEDDDCAGPRDDLPVGVPIQYGPEPATRYATAAAAVTPVPQTPKTTKAATTSHSIPVYPSPSSKSASKSAIIPPVYSAKPSKESKAPVKPTTTAKPSKESKVPVAPTTTAKPSSSVSTDEDCFTQFYTNGYEVVEMIIVETDVTVTATATAPAVSTPVAPIYSTAVSTPIAPVYPASSSSPMAPVYPAASSSPSDTTCTTATPTPAAPAYQHKRHLEKHQRHQ